MTQVDTSGSAVPPPAAGAPAAAPAGGFPGDFAQQLRREAKDAARDLINRLPSLKLTPAQAGDIEFASFQGLRASYLASVARTDQEREEAKSLLREAKAIVANIAAVKAKDAEMLFADVITKILQRGIQFLLSGIAAT